MEIQLFQVVVNLIRNKLFHRVLFEEKKINIFKKSLEIWTYPQINYKVDQAHVLLLEIDLHLKTQQTSWLDRDVFDHV